ncbi:MAG: hypothetical protein PVH62_04775 [Anaerolineae bacterium]|jgi:hypothetical protein
MRRRVLLGGVVLLLLVALLQVGTVGAIDNGGQPYVWLKTLDCTEICIALMNNMSSDPLITTVTLYVDGDSVWQMDFEVPGGWVGGGCFTWADDGDTLTFDLGYDVHNVKVEATGAGYDEGTVGPCAEPPTPTPTPTPPPPTPTPTPTPPPPGDEGCTPGYWRNHLEAWSPTGYSPGDDFDTVFGVDLFTRDITLEEAVNLGGGGVRKLARHGAAALLGAAHPGVAFPLTVAEVIAAVQAGDADTLVDANELGCPLD